jgi:hypothetical protein
MRRRACRIYVEKDVACPANIVVLQMQNTHAHAYLVSLATENSGRTQLPLCVNALVPLLANSTSNESPALPPKYWQRSATRRIAHCATIFSTAWTVHELRVIIDPCHALRCDALTNGAKLIESGAHNWTSPGYRPVIMTLGA